MSNVRNVFEAILKYGHDEDFAPTDEGFEATNAPASAKTYLSLIMERLLEIQI